MKLTAQVSQESQITRLLLACDGVYLEDIEVAMRAIARRVGSLESVVRLPTAVSFTWSSTAGPVQVTLEQFTAPGSIPAEDLTYVVDQERWIARECARLSKFDGFIFVIRPPHDAGPVSGLSARRRVLSDSFSAIGRDAGRVPMGLLILRTESPDNRWYPTTELFQGAMWPDPFFADVDCATGEGISAALNELVRRVLAVRGAPIRGRAPAAVDERPDAQVALPDFQPQLAVEFLRRADVDAARAMLVQAWRECRATEMAELVESLGYTHRTVRPLALRHSQWIDLCRRRDWRDLPLLLDSLLVPEDSVQIQRHVGHVIERLDGLRWWEDDPQITPRLRSALADMTRYRKLSVQQAIGRVLEAHHDPRGFRLFRRYQYDLGAIRPPLSFRSIELVEALPNSRSDYVDAYPHAIPSSVYVPLSHSDAWQSLVEHIHRPLPRPEEMEAVAADPANDHVRREVAERMRERGDPRGEFVLLQLKKASGSLSPEEHEREQALKRTYAWDWLGPLADVVDVENSVFEKGYPVKLTVWTPNTRALNDVIGKPEWATVRELRWGGDPCWEEEAPDAALVEHPIMKSLQTVTTKMPDDPCELAALKRVAWGR